MDHERTFGGWAVAVTAYRETESQFQIRTRAFTIATHEQADAERYARDEMAKDSPSADGWHITTAVREVWLLTCEV